MTAFIWENLVVVSSVLAVVYFVLALCTLRKLLWLHHNTSSGLNTRKLFVMHLQIMCITRFMSFATMAIFDLDNIDVKVSSYDATEEFFQKAELVLFDLPDFCCISAYVLLLVVWSEAYLKSRSHWLSSLQFKRNWMQGYLVFNILLYSSQVALYAFLFIPSVNQNILSNMIYVALAGYNLVLPLFWSAAYIYLGLRFAGFPHSGPSAKERLGSLSFLGKVWTLSRIVWGCIVLTSVLEGWLTKIERSKTFYTLVLIGLFVVVEVIPIILSLKNSALRSMSEGKEPVIREGEKYGSSVGISGAERNGVTIPATYDNGLYGQIILGGDSDSGGGGSGRGNHQTTTTTPLLTTPLLYHHHHHQGGGAVLRGGGGGGEARLSQQDEYQRLFRDTTSSSGDYSFKSAVGQVGRDSCGVEEADTAAAALGLGSSTSSPQRYPLGDEVEKEVSSAKWGWFGY